MESHQVALGLVGWDCRAHPGPAGAGGYREQQECQP